MTKVVLEVPIKSRVEETSAVPSKIVYACEGYLYTRFSRSLAELKGVERKALGDLAYHFKNGAGIGGINAFIKERIPSISDKRISEILERKVFEDLAGELRKNVMERDEVITFIKESAPGISDERIVYLLDKLVKDGGLVEKVYRDRSGVKIPLSELYPPVVYFYDSKGYPSALSGLLGPERNAFEKLRDEFKMHNGVMSHSEIANFIKKKLPDIKEGRISGLLSAIAADGGLLRREVAIKKEELADYYKGLACSEGPDNPSFKTQLKWLHGIDRRFWTVFEKHYVGMVEPLLENSRRTNEMLLGQMEELRKIGFSERMVLRCVRAGMFSDDIEKYHLSSYMVDELLRAHTDWRKHLMQIMEIADRYNFRWQMHPEILEQVSIVTLENHLKTCKKEGLDPEEDRLITVMGHSEKVFNNAVERILIRNVITERAKPEEIQSVMEMYRRCGVESSGVNSDNTFVVRDKGKLIGAVTVEKMPDFEWIHIKALGIEQNGQNNYVEAKLIVMVGKEAKKDGFKAIVAEVPLEQRQSYSKLGFWSLDSGKMAREV
jgi:N-acetylglutamate synthase-like GNAT family acetyltransferase/DNA-binding phage protein